MNISALPVLPLKHVWHQGSLNAADKGLRGASYEGAGLSVSTDPHAWEAIARLGGTPLWELSRLDGAPGRFVGYHDITAGQRRRIEALGRARGWLVPALRHKVSWTDSDDGEECYSLFATEEAANAEADELANYQEAVSVAARELDVATSLLEAAVGQPVDDMLAFDMVLTALVEETPELDGVWWADRLAPEQLCAPRGCISRPALSRWTWRRQHGMP